LENCSCAFQVATAQGGCVNNCAADPSLCGVVTDAMVADARIDATPDAGEPFYFCECKGLPSCSGNTYLAVPAAACKSEVFPVPCETVTYAFCAGGTVYDACRCDVPAGWVQEGLDGGNDTGADSAPDVSTPSDASDGG
jgi:hypothetical protein